jgi:hypothetical protein
MGRLPRWSPDPAAQLELISVPPVESWQPPSPKTALANCRGYCPPRLKAVFKEPEPRSRRLSSSAALDVPTESLPPELRAATNVSDWAEPEGRTGELDVPLCVFPNPCTCVLHRRVRARKPRSSAFSAASTQRCTGPTTEAEARHRPNLVDLRQGSVLASRD